MSREFLYKSSGSSNGSVILSYVTRSLFSCQIYCFSTGTAWTAWKIALDSTSFSLSVFPLVFLGFYFKNVVCVGTYMTIYMADLSGRYWNISVLTTVIWRHHFQVGWDYHVNLDELLICSGQLYIFCQKAVIFVKSQYS